MSRPFEASDLRVAPPEESLRADFLARHPEGELFATLDARRAAPTPTWGWRRPALVTSGALAALAALLLVVTPPPPAPGGLEGVRTKGIATADPGGVVASQPTLDFFVLHAGSVRPGSPGEVCTEGDRVRFVVSQHDYSYVAMLSLDRYGRVTAIYPDADGMGRSLSLIRGQRIPLPGSRQLDDYRGLERYVALFSQRPVPMAELAARAQGAFGDAGGGEAALRHMQLPVHEGEASAAFWIEKR
jgi:hypothetical protein